MWDLAVLPDGRVASAADQVHVWKPDEIEGTGIVYAGHTGEVFALYAFDDGRLASGGSDTSVQVWDPDEPGEAPSRFSDHFAAVWSLTRLDDGRMVSAGQAATVRVWSP